MYNPNIFAIFLWSFKRFIFFPDQWKKRILVYLFLLQLEQSFLITNNWHVQLGRDIWFSKILQMRKNVLIPIWKSSIWVSPTKCNRGFQKRSSLLCCCKFITNLTNIRYSKLYFNYILRHNNEYMSFICYIYNHEGVFIAIKLKIRENI